HDPVVLEPGDPVDDGPKTEHVRPEGRRSAHSEGEGREAARADERLTLDRDAVGRRPADAERAHRAIVPGDTEVDLLTDDAAGPRTRAGVADTDHQWLAHLAGPQGRMAGLIDDGAVEPKVARHGECRAVLEPGDAIGHR